MRVLVVGLGSIGKRHIENIKSIDANTEVAVWRQHSRKADLGNLSSLVDEVFFSQVDAFKFKPEVVFITNPATMHIETALLFAKKNCDLFIEKPLSVNEQGLNELMGEVSERGLVATVGYVLRFSESFGVMKKAIEENRIGKVLSVRASVGKNLLTWRPNRRYQDTVSARKNLGGGVVFELSHELDYVRWLVGEVTHIQGLVGKVSNLEIDVEDIAEIILKFECGAIGNVHLDMIDYASQRNCRIVGEKATLAWDWADNNSVRLYSADRDEWLELYAPQSQDRNTMYISQLKHFFNCIANRTAPMVSLKDARRVMQMVLAVKRSAETKEFVLL